MKSLFTPFLAALLTLSLTAGQGRADVNGPERLSPYASPGSIFPDPARGMNNAVNTEFVSDPVSCSVGQFITIIVNLSNTSSLSKQLNTAKTASVADAVSSILNANNTKLSMGWNANQAFKGGGSQADTEALTTTIQACITGIRPNGTLQIEARRQMQIGKEKSSMVLTGLVNRQDLAADNTISSTLVAELAIKQDGTGDLSRSERKGWLTTIYEFLSPF